MEKYDFEQVTTYIENENSLKPICSILQSSKQPNRQRNQNNQVSTNIGERISAVKSQIHSVYITPLHIPYLESHLGAWGSEQQRGSQDPGRKRQRELAREAELEVSCSVTKQTEQCVSLQRNKMKNCFQKPQNGPPFEALEKIDFSH